MRRALYIGRFQPFHLGHIDVLQHIEQASDIDETVIAVGSPQYDHHTKSPAGTWAANPFTFDERKEMIVRSLLPRLKRAWSVHAVRDQHPDHERWYQHLLESVPPFEVLYTSSASERRLFESKDFPVRDFPRRFEFHAGTIRTWIAEGKSISHAVPPEVAEVVERVGARERMVTLLARDRG